MKIVKNGVETPLSLLVIQCQLALRKGKFQNGMNKVKARYLTSATTDDITIISNHC